MLNLHVVFAIDRAGLVGDDGPTHHGAFDVGFLRQMPGMLILNPVSFAEQQDMLNWAVNCYDGPVAVRYPRGTEGNYRHSDWTGLESEAVCHRQGGDVTLVTYGTMLENTLDAAELLSAQGIEATVIRLMNLSALGSDKIADHMTENKQVIVVEETCSGSGIREALAWELTRLCPECTVYGMDLGADFVPHGNQKLLYKHCGLDEASIARFVKEVLSHEN